MKKQENIKQVNTGEGKLLFFGGVYGNLQSLETLKKWADDNNYLPQHIICTGDIIGYCAQPNECIEMIKGWGVHAIAGNVEIQIREDKEDCGCDFNSGGACDLLSKNWYAYARSQITMQNKNWLGTLPEHISFEWSEKKIVVVHGSWFHTAAFIFKSTEWATKKKNFAATGADIIIAGHCGLPFAEERDNKIWLNAGVIGMPANDGTNRVWFLTLDKNDSKFDYHFHHYTYDNNKASELMNRNGLPAAYAKTLISGVWDNCEILPPEEACLQGKKIEFEN